jgi:membrane protein YqaA with SNARE-associated domain
LTELIAHLSLLGTAFLAATILPGSSEAMLVALIVLYPASTFTLFLAATIGNTAGALANWFLGRGFMRLAGARWFPATTAHIDRATAFFSRYGSWPLLFSWLPIVGDPLTVAAGVLGIRLPVFLPLVAIGKAARYALLIYGADLLRPGP